MSALKIDILMMQVLRETVGGKINWKVTSAPAPFSRGTDSYIPIYLHADYKNAELAIYEHRYKYWRDEDDFVWSTEIKFAVIKDGIPATESRTYSPVLNQLFDAARDSAANIDELLDSLIKK